jgi:hypothetical protein
MIRDLINRDLIKTLPKQPLNKSEMYNVRDENKKGTMF